MGAAAMAEDLRWDVITASRPEQALDILSARAEIDVLVSDVAMPNMTGIDLAHAARKINPDLPIVLASGHPSNSMHNLPNIVALLKPYTASELEKAVQTALSSFDGG
jgi:two-component SAPR family response regulator